MRKLLLFVAIVGLAVAAWFLFLQERLPDFMQWVRGQGLAGALLVGAGYALATVLMIPGALVTLFVGAVYGPWLGTALVSPASVLGASAAFLLGRSVFRPVVEARMQDSARFQALQTALERRGLYVLTLVRLSPVFPFTVVNYAFGLTPLKTWQFVLGSFVGMLPGTLMYVYLGSTIGDLAAFASGDEALERGTGARVLQYIGLAATVAVTLVVTRMARRALSETAPAAVVDDGASVAAAVVDDGAAAAGEGV